MDSLCLLTTKPTAIASSIIRCARGVILAAASLLLFNNPPTTTATICALCTLLCKFAVVSSPNKWTTNNKSLVLQCQWSHSTPGSKPSNSRPGRTSSMSCAIDAKFTGQYPIALRYYCNINLLYCKINLLYCIDCTLRERERERERARERERKSTCVLPSIRWTDDRWLFRTYTLALKCSPDLSANH
jgi:hypothetical protein